MGIILKIIGICFLPITLIVGLTAFASPYNYFSLPFIVLGFLLCLIVIGIGEILLYLKKGSEKNDKKI